VSHTHELLLRPRPRLPLGQRVATAGLIAILGAAVTFFVALFVAILAMLAFGFVSAARPDMRVAYRVVAFPAAVMALPAVFALSLWWQGRASSKP
jgi:hypothetical protein